MSMNAFTRLALGVGLALGTIGSAQAAEEDTRIGFIVKKPEQAWFINEQEAATQVGEEQGFRVVRLGGEDGQEVLSAIDNLNSQGAQGFVICPPDVRLGPAIMNRAHQYGMKVITVDDRFQRRRTHGSGAAPGYVGLQDRPAGRRGACRRDGGARLGPAGGRGAAHHQ